MEDNTQYQLDFTQQDINAYLILKGLDPLDAVYNTMLDLVYVMEAFIEGGGTYENASELDEDTDLPLAYMQVCYEGKCLLLARNLLSGQPMIKIIDADWYVLTVHPDHLDIVLCHLLQVPSGSEELGND